MTFKLESRGDGDLKTRYRPQKLSEICPTFHMKDAQAILGDTNSSRVWLFEGLTGCGKTSLSRIIARAAVCDCDSGAEKPCLQCGPCRSMESSMDFMEINGADVRGIDPMREITRNMNTYPQDLAKKIYIFDECFSATTLVETSDGPREICSIRPGDAVASLAGLDSVKHVFKNKVPLSRVMKLHLSDGRIIFTTKEHRFWTNLGWVEARDLQERKALLFDFCSNIVNSPTEEEDFESEDVQVVRPEIYHAQESPGHLQQVMRTTTPKSSRRSRAVRDKKVPGVSSSVYGQTIKSKALLLSVVRGEEQVKTPRVPSGIMERLGQGQDLGESYSAARNGDWHCPAQATELAYEIEKPISGSEGYRQDEGDEAEERNVTQMARKKRRKRPTHGAAETTTKCARATLGCYIKVGTRGRNTYQAKESLSDKLSRRSWKQEVEDRSRDRWKGTQHPQGERARQEEDLPAHPTRVARSEVYKRGGNDDSFSSVIGDREHSQGFVEFYDLEMNGHPSFFANGVCVHNCQQITPQAQELLNKVLEEPPEESLIFLCTTNKKGLKRTLLGRCSKINFRRITKKQCGTIITQVFKDAGQAVPDQGTTEDLFRRANGSVRDLLVMLDSYLRGTFKVGSDYAEEDISVGAPDIFALVKGYIQKDWGAVRKILVTENVKNDPDGYRETVCAFLARDALKFPEAKMSIASALGHLGGSMWEEPKREQHSLLVLRSLRACYKPGKTTTF